MVAPAVPDDHHLPPQMVERMEWVNGARHRVTAAVWELRLTTHEWTEEGFGGLIRGYAESHPEVKAALFEAVNRS